jgi:hypothetical protein
MTFYQFLAWLTVVGLPILAAIIIGLYTYRRVMRQTADLPAPLKKMETKPVDPSAEFAEIVYGSYIKYAQNIFWYEKQFEWDFRKMAEYLKPKTKNRFADRAIMTVLRECQRIDKERREKVNSEIRNFPERNRHRKPQPPWVSISYGDVRLAVETTISSWTVDKIMGMKNDLDIPPKSGMEYRP